MNLKDKTVVIDNKTYRYSKIVMLPTDSKSIVYIGNDAKTLHKGDVALKSIDNTISQHLYFLSPYKICEGDWFLHNKTIEQLPTINISDNKKKQEYIEDLLSGYNCYKIIASTDPSLNLPKPSDSFLQVYIDAYNKGEKIEECLVEYEEYATETTYNLGIDCSIPLFRPKVTKGEITIRKVKESLKELCKKDPELRKEIIEFAAKYARKVQEDNILNGWKPMHNNKWIEENL